MNPQLVDLWLRIIVVSLSVAFIVGFFAYWSGRSCGLRLERARWFNYLGLPQHADIESKMKQKEDREASSRPVKNIAFRCAPIVILLFGMGVGIAAWWNGLATGEKRCRVCPPCSDAAGDLRWNNPAARRSR